MLVEDEEGVRKLVRALLHSQGYSVLEARDAFDALRIADETASTIDLLLTDVVMPGMSGRELADRLLEERPETRLLYMSGYTEDTVLLHGVRTSGTAFLCKPFSPDLLLKRVREVLDGARSPAVPLPN
jgi:DNA-binding response OmpR family regulator